MEILTWKKQSSLHANQWQPENDKGSVQFCNEMEEQHKEGRKHVNNKNNASTCS